MKEDRMFRAYAVEKPKTPLKPITYDPGVLGPDEVEINVQFCGICHSDLSMIDNEWGMTKYPLVPGHEVAGTVGAIGSNVKHLEVGARVGLGWMAGSCMTCKQCLSGQHSLCPWAEATIVGRHGGFADKVRCKAAFAIPIPDPLDAKKVGPLFCGGSTVFNPMIQFDVKPTMRVGVVGIGGLGHMALMFLNKWGCEVTAFTSSDSKRDEAMSLGAHRAVNSRDPAALKAIAGQLDYIISTVNVSLDWPAYLSTLAPRGRLHMVGVVPEPMQIPVFSLLPEQKQVSASPVGPPAVQLQMVDFCARHKIVPVTEHFPMSRVNDAMEHLRSGKARYRIVLENDFK